MDFSLTEEQQAMVDAARRFAQHAAPETAREWLPQVIRDGTAQIMKMIIARQMTGDGA